MKILSSMPIVVSDCFLAGARKEKAARLLTAKDGSFGNHYKKMCVSVPRLSRFVHAGQTRFSAVSPPVSLIPVQLR
ncbi:MAG: hypothetical protein Q4F27_03535, partial [Desulfovibrionaceae bacterium]|nr:hypothetical protein [Desulfovibrionaceae bacterium]